MKVGLYFGSFNPVHIGHLIIADYFAENTDLDKVWFVVSPQNPFKNKSTLLDEKQRLYMVNLAVEDNYKLFASNIEFHLPRPSYTIDTLTYLSEKHPDYEFVVIIGSDNLPGFEKWKNYAKILSGYQVYAYKRRNFEEIPELFRDSIKLFDVPLIDISASYIREQLRSGHSVRYLLPPKVWECIRDMHFYSIGQI